ncbi:oxidoreductase [Liquorilactobacillus aquaticus DSM 21051]|uniref:Oxidoreductase n=1 Tax=Liquorilactobacillus aquaticus DSM 21051 TaxID=1423725 RepID=A0A0R2D612_9LACO|nr:NADP-dependent oxidoreductase [Liquorilactobacillus aquaticus]KRM96025.1 oxidoreductase [Liquorilactobacillus aquaticus DSM 21051]
MKAIGINQYGSSGVLEELTLDIPSIGSREILVKTKAFAINPLDVAIREGRFNSSVLLLFPTILGTDAVGTVVKVGAKVENYHVGDEIIAHAGYGTYAEYFCVSPEHIGIRPKQYDVYEAAGLPLSGITAYNVLIHLAQARAGQRIVIFGASGGVGSMVVQMAKAYGLSVIGIDRAINKAYVLSIGAYKFVDMDNFEEIEALRDSADIIIDATNDGLGTDIGLNLVKKKGMYVSLTQLPVQRNNKKKVALKVLVPQKKYLDRDAFAAISLMIRNRQLYTRIDKVLDFNLADVRKGQDYVAEGKHSGKVIVSLTD